MDNHLKEKLYFNNQSEFNFGLAIDYIYDILKIMKLEYHKIDMNFDDEISYIVNELDNLSEKTF